MWHFKSVFPVCTCPPSGWKQEVHLQQGKNTSERRELDPNMLSCCVYLDNLRFVVPLSKFVCFSLKVLPEMSAQPWLGCVCDIEALRQNYATSPSKSFLSLVLFCLFLRRLLYFKVPFNVCWRSSRSATLSLICFNVIHFIFSCHGVISLSLQCSYGKPGYTAAGQNRGMEEDSESAGQRPRQRSTTMDHKL